MKKLTTFLSLTLFFLTLTSLGANNFSFSLKKGVNNDTLTCTFMVNGNSTCKTNIETTLTSQTGVISAVWDSGTKQMTVVFKAAQIKNSDLHSFLAMAGYDTSELRAKQSVYDALPASCKYTREPETE
ncbi:MAG: cation-transporting ATPase [Bacteroidota bacterium]|jgi:hypothetical protein|nr:cation-transporting ATPase [Bacteroidota bacterium]